VIAEPITRLDENPEQFLCRAGGEAVRVVRKDHFDGVRVG
jgi:hypothetical protein